MLTLLLLRCHIAFGLKVKNVCCVNKSVIFITKRCCCLIQYFSTIAMYSHDCTQTLNVGLEWVGGQARSQNRSG